MDPDHYEISSDSSSSDTDDSFITGEGQIIFREIGEVEEAMGNFPVHRAILEMEAGNESTSSPQPEESQQAEPPGLCTFDTGLPCQHSYLGNDLEVLRGRTLFDDNSYHTLDIMNPSGVILVPGQTLPLTVFDPRTISMLKQCIEKDGTFGVLSNWITEGNVVGLDNVGTTAEIYEYQSEEGQVGFRIKAKARQRFKIVKAHKRFNGLTATVKILPEVCLPDSLDGVKFLSLNRHRSRHPLRCRRRDAVVTGWPEWVHRQYDAKRLISKIKEKLMFLEQGQESSGIKINIPDDPTELSFWVAHNLPIREEQIMTLLKLNSPIQRLRWELSMLHKVQILCCNRCWNQVGSHTDAFSMSAEGPQGTYVNPGGYLHETLTLYKVKYVVTVGPPSTEFSWFPGYAWSIAKCRQCSRHMGWKFTATNKKLRPKEFWGLCRSSLIAQFGDLNNVEDQAGLVI